MTVKFFRYDDSTPDGDMIWEPMSAADIYDFRDMAISAVSGAISASDVPVDINTFDGQLTSADNTVQKALETLDNLSVSAVLADKEVYDIFLVSAHGQTQFWLSDPPLNPETLRMFAQEGIEQVNGTDFTVSGSLVTYISSVPVLEIGDRIIMKFTRQ